MWIREYNTILIIKEVRLQLNLSQEELARELGVCFATVNRWERGRFLPSKLALMQLQTYCDRMIDIGRLIVPEDIHLVPE